MYTTLNTKTQLAAHNYQDKAFQADKKKSWKRYFVNLLENNSKC